MTSRVANADDGETGPTQFQDVVWQKLLPTAGGRTAEQAAAAARQVAPTLLVSRAEMQAAKARSHSTLATQIPRVAVAGSYSRTNAISFDIGGGEQFTLPRNNYRIESSLTIPISNYAIGLRPLWKSAKADEEAAKLRNQSEVERVEANASIAYYDWIRAKAQVAVAELSLQSARTRFEDAKRLQKGDEITPADVLQLESLVASSQIALGQAQSFLRLAAQNLRLQTGWQGPLTLGEDIRSEVTTPLLKQKLAAIVAQGKTGRSDSRALDASIRSNDYAYKSILPGLLPRLDAVANLAYANPNQQFFPPTQTWNSSWSLGLQLSWSLDGFFGTKTRRSELKASTQLLRAQKRSLDQSIELEVKSAWEEWKRAKLATTLSETEMRAAIAAYDQRVKLFRGGDVTSTDLVEASVQRHNATMRNVSARIDQRIALTKLQRAVGKDKR